MQTPIQVKCPSCEASLKVSVAINGKAVRCPKCQGIVCVSDPAVAKTSYEPAKPPKAAPAQPLASPAPANPLRKKIQVATIVPELDSTTTFSSDEIEFGSLEMPDHATAPGSFPGAGIAAFPTGAMPGLNTGVPGFKRPVPRVAKSTLNAVQHLPQLTQKLTEQFSSPIARQPVGMAYQLGITVMAGFMLLLPLAYIGLIGSAGFGVFYYTFYLLPSWLEHLPRGRAAIIMIVIYAAPIVAGITTIIFMIKPLFVTFVYERESRSRSLRRETEPAIFHLVDMLCDAIGAPKPCRINVNTDVNASASYGEGFRSLFSNQLVLTFGVPLVTGLTAKQFTGILAHEFGHFSQSMGMRASFVVRSINGWFAKVVYQRDQIDDLLEETISESESAFGLVLVFAKVCVWLSRGVLWCFMMLAHLASSFLLRQMEFDADRYEAIVSGSKSFAETSEALRLLGLAQMKSMYGLSHLALKEAVLVDDIPYMVAAVRDQMPHEQKRKVLDSNREEKTGIFDTHPCDAERIAAAEALSLKGLFQLDIPAQNLFRNFKPLCSGVTEDFYRNRIGRMIDPRELQPTVQHLGKVLSM